MYEIKDSPGRGKGVFATQLIPKGTRIMSEEPVLAIDLYAADVERLLADAVHNLSKEHREQFLAMPNVYPYATGAEYFVGIMRTVSLDMETASGQHMSGFFPDAARINHACDNNAQKHWNGALYRHTIHARKDIAAGEEITILYLADRYSRHVRQSELQSKFHFTCHCGLCSLSRAESDEMDMKLARVDFLEYEVARMMAGRVMILQPQEILQRVRDSLLLGEGMGLAYASWAWPYTDAALVYATNGDLARSRVCFQLAVDAWTAEMGPDDAMVAKGRLWQQDPTKHYFFRDLNPTTRWATAPSEADPYLAMLKTNPGAVTSDLSSWLWERIDGGTPTPKPNTWHASTLAFAHLPHEDSLDPSFYSPRPDDGVYPPNRFWCYVGEITEANHRVRLNMTLKDAHGKDVLCAFHTSGRGAEFPSGLARVGHTVVILYAMKQNSLFNPPRLRVDDISTVQILPMTLGRVLDLGRDFARYGRTKTDKAANAAICHGCETRGTDDKPLKDCAGCHCYAYCDKACKVVGWKDKGHKTTCKVLKNKEVKDLLTLNWETVPL